MKQELVIGRVQTAHGIKGELKVDPTSRETAHFVSLERVTLTRGAERHEMTVEWARPAHRKVLLKLEGIDSPEEGKRWRGWEIVVDRERAAPLGEDEYYYADLIGLRVLVDGTERGTVRDVWEGGRNALLGIRLPSGEDRLVPFVAAFVESVDLAGGTLTLTTDEVLE